MAGLDPLASAEEWIDALSRAVARVHHLDPEKPCIYMSRRTYKRIEALRDSNRKWVRACRHRKARRLRRLAKNRRS